MTPRHHLLILVVLTTIGACSSKISASLSAEMEISSSLALYKQTERLFRDDNPDGVLSAIVAMQQKVVNPFAVKQSRLQMATHFFEKNALHNATTILNRYLLDPKDPVIYPKAKALQIKLLIAQSQKEDALEAYKALISIYPQHDPDREILESISALYDTPITPKDILPTPQDQIEYIRRLFESRLFPATIAQIKLYRDHLYGTRFWADMLYYEGVSFYHLAHYWNAYHLLEEAIGLRRDSKQKWGEAEYWFAKSLKASNQSEWAQQRFMRAIQSAMPNDWYLGEAYYNVLTYLKDTNGPKDQIDLYTQLFERTSKHSPFYSRYQWEKAPTISIDIQARLTKLYSELIKSSPSIKDKSIDPMAWGNTHIPITYAVKEIYERHLSLDKSSSHNPWKSFVETMRDFKMESIVFDQLNSRITANPSKSGQELEALMYLHYLRREFPQSIQSVSRYLPLDVIQNGMLLPEIIPFYYPRPYWAWISDAANKYKVDPYLLIALIHQRSHFNVALEIEDSYGLFQIPLHVAVEISNELGLKWNGKSDLLAPQKNIVYAAIYLSKLKKIYENNYALMIAAATTDVATVNQWLGSQSKTPDTLQDTLSYIKFTHTRETIREVLQKYLIYQALYKIF